MKITERENDTCRFWGYEPASCINNHNASLSREERETIRAQVVAERTTIKAAGLKASGMGLRAKIAAIGAASRIEKATGIEMHVFKHDYL